jgi:hypothetical protein
MKICLIYHQRLGDILRILPIARHLANQGHEVLVEVLPQYVSIFGAISYAKPSDPKDHAAHNFDKVYNLQVWPTRYADFMESGKSWSDYVFGLFPEFSEISRKPIFDLLDEGNGLAHYGFTEPICLFAPFGYSQTTRYKFDALLSEARALSNRKLVMLVDPAQHKHLLELGVKDGDMLCAKKLSDLPRLICEADDFFTINSSPCIIAGAVRQSFFHVIEGTQNDEITAASRIVTIRA